MARTSFLLTTACLIAATTTLYAAPSQHYGVTAKIAGPDGAWDYASVDPVADRLFLARGTSVTAVNLSDHTVATIGAVDRGHTVLPLPGGRLLVTSSHDDSVRIVDEHDGHELARIAVKGNPDAALYDAASGHAVVMNAKAGTVSVIDASTAHVSATIAVKPALEFGVLGRGGMLFVNDEDANEIETIDLVKGKAGTAIALPGCEGPTGLAYDAHGDQLISACANGKAAVVKASSRRLVKLLDIGKGPDAVILDEKRRMAFIPCGHDGTLVVISLDGTKGAKVVDTVKTEMGARTGAVDPRDGAIYLPTAAFGQPAAPGGRPKALPGTFHVLVIKPLA